MNLVDELRAVSSALREAGVVHAVCGGIAVTIHGATRSTKDIDILIARADLPAALDAVRPLGYEFAALPMTFDRGTPAERHVRRVTKVEGNEHLILDLILGEAAFAGFLDDRIEVELEDGPLSVVSLSTLAAMKRLAGRDQDLADLASLGLAPGADGDG